MIIGKTSLAFDSAANGVFELFDQYPYVILWDFIVYLYAKITMTTMATNSKREGVSKIDAPSFSNML